MTLLNWLNNVAVFIESDLFRLFFISFCVVCFIWMALPREVNMFDDIDLDLSDSDEDDLTLKP